MRWASGLETLDLCYCRSGLSSCFPKLYMVLIFQILLLQMD